MAIRAPDPHNLRNAAQSAAVIEVDRECVACGYNLRGLRVGFPCPECGTHITGTLSEGIDEPLSLAPPRVIVVFIRGCWTATSILAAAIALAVLNRLTDWTSSWQHWALLGLSVLWVGAVFWLTPAVGLPQAASRGFNRRSKLRHSARWLQWGWVIAATMLVLLVEFQMNAAQRTACRAGLALGSLLGIIAAVLLSILMERLAEWARDDTAALLFNWAAWTIPITTLLLSVDVPLPVIGLVLMIAWLVGVGLFPVALVSLSSSVTLSVVHNYEYRQRAQRRAERQRRADEQVHRTVQVMDAARAARRNP